jgi:hypothetical protein
LRNKVWRKNNKSKINIILTWIINIAIVVCIILLIAVLFKEKTEITDPGEASLPPVSASDVTTLPPATETTVTTVTTAATTLTETTVSEVSEVTDSSINNVSETVAESVPTLADENYDKEFFNDFLFIGDSISTGFSGFDFLNSANVYAKIGFTPSSVRTSDNNGVTVYQKLAAKKPSTVVILLGTNGLSYLDIDDMIKDYKLFISEIRDILPESRVVILSIPPVTKEHEATEPENITLIKNYNEKLLALSAETESDFIDVYALLADDDGYTRSDYAENDGLHIKGPAYKAILHLVEETLKDETTE